MKILLIHPFIQLGGAELVMIKQANYFVSKGHQVGIACVYVNERFLEKIDSRVSIYTPQKYISFLCSKSKLMLLFLGLPALTYIVTAKSFFYDLLFPHNFPSILSAVVGNFFSNKKIVWEFNEGAPMVKGLYFLENLVASFANSIIVLDKKNQKVVRKRFNKQATVIHPGVDVAYWSKKVTANTFANKTLLLSVGKLHPQKNQILLLSVLANLLPKHPSLHLVLIGKGPDEKRIQARMHDFHLEKHVSLLGNIDNPTLRKFYSSTFLLCFPAIQQTWGLTPFEALCQKKISVISQDCGAAEVLGPENIALLAHPTVKDFSNKISWALTHKTTIQKMGEKGYFFVKNTLTWNDFCSSVYATLKKTIV